MFEVARNGLPGRWRKLAIELLLISLGLRECRPQPVGFTGSGREVTLTESPGFLDLVDRRLRQLGGGPGGVELLSGCVGVTGLERGQSRRSLLVRRRERRIGIASLFGQLQALGPVARDLAP